MKFLIQIVVVAAALAAPAVSFAQRSNAPLTRAQVYAKLVQLEKAGYNPGTVSVYYPADIQVAEARLAAQSGASSSSSSPGAARVAGTQPNGTV